VRRPPSVRASSPDQASSIQRMSSGRGRVDVEVESKRPDEPAKGEAHPNTCPVCGSHYRDDELAQALRVCPQCGHHFRVRARERIEQLVDPGSFAEEDADLRSADPLNFFDLRPYTERLAEAEIETGLGDAIVCGGGAIDGEDCQVAVMDFAFMGGSMGSVVGEKFVRACERATSSGVPLVSIPASGGARMQEGILALMQLPKTICAVDELHESQGSMISVLTHPTTGGVLASFASLGDVVIAEPGALMSFAGPRVVAQTTREKLPDDFGLAESNYRFGHLDAIVPRSELRQTLGRLLRLFARH
jgi:acetyl-CoA carboxylase carboxyl transferase beta subunit